MLASLHLKRIPCITVIVKHMALPGGACFLTSESLRQTRSTGQRSTFTSRQRLVSFKPGICAIRNPLVVLHTTSLDSRPMIKGPTGFLFQKVLLQRLHGECFEWSQSLHVLVTRHWREVQSDLDFLMMVTANEFLRTWGVAGYIWIRLLSWKCSM